MAYYIKKAEIAMLEEVKTILERNMQEADKDTYSAFCEYIATNKAYKSRTESKNREWRSTPEGRESNRISSLKSVRKYREKLKQK
jgi:hypothetical protein